MSKTPQDRALGQTAPGRTDELNKGKKRKRAGGHERARDDIVKKGTGKLTKFGEPDEGTSSKEKDVEPTVTVSQKEPETTRTTKDRLSENALEQSAPEPTPEEQKTISLVRNRKSEKRSKPINGGNSKPHANGHGSRPNQVNAPTHLLRKRDALLPLRKALPIWPHADMIRSALRKNNVLVLTGETGSGKSTQVPQFLVSEPWCTKTIAITQPRRVAAISLARRVAEEMGSLFGGQSPAAKVGYSVRFDNSTGPGTKIKFLTEGMLLQEMLRDSDLNQYSAVVVDEVHERSVNVDLILGFLRNLLAGIQTAGKKRKHPLKVVVMSATADVDALVQFFKEGLRPADMDGPTGERTKERAEIDDSTKRNSIVNEKEDSSTNSQISTCFVQGRQYPVKTTYLSEATQDWVESALKIIFQIHYKEPLPGDILVFLTGQDTIEGLEKLVNDYAEGMDKEVPKVCCSIPDLFECWASRLHALVATIHPPIVSVPGIN